jgi:stage II sporulation protein P
MGDAHRVRLSAVLRIAPAALGLALCLLMSASWPACAERELSPDEGYYEVLDEDDNPITATAILISVDDMFIDSANRSYRIESVVEKTARARFLSVVELPEVDSGQAGVLDRLKGLVGLTSGGSGDSIHLAQDRSRPIAIYCTHSDESYVPTSGTASKTHEPGDVYNVAETLKAAITRLGGNAVVSHEQHHPHDGAAYERSRRTATQLMQQRPAALVDVHRDAVPAYVYEANVAGRNIAAVKLVVGRENANSGANLEFAKYLKAVADKKYPGLVEGILWGTGSYNQDLSPRSVLFEAGTHTNSLEQAKHGMDLMADVLATVVYGATPDGQPQPTRTGTVARTVLWIAVILLAIGGVYLFVNEGGLEGVKARLRSFTSKEIAGREDDTDDTHE